MDYSSALLVSSLEYKTLLKERLKSAISNDDDNDRIKKQNIIKEDDDEIPQFVHSWRRHLDNGNKTNNRTINESSISNHNDHNDLLSKLDNMSFNDKRNKINNDHDVNNNINNNNNWYKEFRDKEYDASSWNLLIETDDNIKPKSPLRSPNTKSPIKLFQNVSYSPKRDSIQDKAVKKFDNVLMKRYFQSLKLKASEKRVLRTRAIEKFMKMKQKTYFRDWYCIHRASILSQKVKQRKLWKCLCIWNQNSLKSKRLSDAMYNYAEHHYRIRSGKILMNRIKTLLFIKKCVHEKKLKTETALNYRYEKLLKTCLSAWKYQAKKLIKEKLSKEEHIQRLERIKKLVNTIGSSKNTTTSQKNAINNVDKLIPNSAGKEEDLIYEQNEHNNSKDQKYIDKYDQYGSFKNDIELHAHEKEASVTKAEEKESKISAHEANRIKTTPRTPNSRSNNIAASQKQHQTPKTIEKPKNYPSKEELEMRAIERKKRVVELRKQAEERVAKRQKEEETIKSSKLQVEEESLNKMREERRVKLEKDKASSVRTKEMQVETQRKLENSIKFYNTQLIMRLGFSPWCRLLEIKKMNTLKAANFRDDYLLQSSWIAFYGYVMMLKNERVRREYRASAYAVAHFRRFLLKKTWKGWSLYRKLLKAKAKAVTGHFSRYSVVYRAYKAWRLTLERVRRKIILQLRAVEPRGNKCTMKFYWNRWYEFLQQSLIEREINNRADLTWNKVQKWLS